MKPTAASFDADISKYLDVMNSIQLQETMATVHFLDINFDGLKATIIEHCSIWQQKFTALLLRMTDAMVDHVYHYIAENSTKLVARMDCYSKQKGDCVQNWNKIRFERMITRKTFYILEIFIHISLGNSFLLK